MIRKLYIDNFRCLDNFELELSEMNIFLGANGTGKTSVLSVLRRMQDLVVHGAKVAEAFPDRHVSQGHEEAWQRFRVEALVEGAEYATSGTVTFSPSRFRTAHSPANSGCARSFQRSSKRFAPGKALGSWS